ncbi:MAG TPA: DUF167 domain-containing protein [bacterium]|nr:DUF167 domain-containing protein [bacterium]
MIITAKVKTNAKTDALSKDGDHYIIQVKATPIENKANLAIIKLLSKEFKIPTSHVIIKKGLSSKIKQIELLID